jgi:hypothetical protein
MLGLQLICPSVSMLCVSSWRAADAGPMRCRGQSRGFGAGMAAADHDDVELRTLAASGCSIALALTGTIGAWGWIGVVPLATAALGFCPLYTVLGFSSCPVET